MLRDFIFDYLNKKDTTRSNKSNLVKLLMSDPLKSAEVNGFVGFGTFKQRLYHLMNDTKDQPRCPVCGGQVRWVENDFKYRETCSQKCSGKLNMVRKNPRVVEHPALSTKEEYYAYFSSNKMKITESSVSKYYPEILKAVKSVDFVDEFNVKVYCWLKGITQVPFCKHCGEKQCEFDTFSKGFHEYCSVSCSSSSEAKQSKIRSTVRKKYGVDNVGEATRRQALETMQKRYGGHISTTDNFKKNMREKMIEKHGREHYFQSPDFKEKSKQHFLEKYGVESCMQVPDVIKKSLETRKEMGLIYKWTKEQVASYEAYRRHVNFLSEKSYELHREQINPDGLERGMLTHHLDHIYPVILGFMNGLPAEEVAHWRNLRVIPHYDNRSKGPRTDMTLEEFRSMVGGPA